MCEWQTYSEMIKHCITVYRDDDFISNYLFQVNILVRYNQCILHVMGNDQVQYCDDEVRYLPMILKSLIDAYDREYYTVEVYSHSDKKFDSETKDTTYIHKNALIAFIHAAIHDHMQ